MRLRATSALRHMNGKPPNDTAGTPAFLLLFVEDEFDEAAHVILLHLGQRIPETHPALLQTLDTTRACPSISHGDMRDSINDTASSGFASIKPTTRVWEL